MQNSKVQCKKNMGDDVVVIVTVDGSFSFTPLMLHVER